MQISSLQALSPLDGRYRRSVASLAEYFSEKGLIRYRVEVEIEYLIALFDTRLEPMPLLSESMRRSLRALFRDFSDADAEDIKKIEAVTNHDVKAVEYWIKQKIAELEDEALAAAREFVHFGLTSQDINNTALPMSLRDALHRVYLPSLEKLINRLSACAKKWADYPMLARTHGQAASPTTLGKEFAVFVARLREQADLLRQTPTPAKFGGATGNFNAHYAAYPDYNWQRFGDTFVNHVLGLRRSYPTTQIEHYDGLGRIFDTIKRINVILLDLCQDAWLYVSFDYFKQELKAGEVGSSAMPHKVNPIDFENAEGNAGLSNALLEFLSRKLPVSRLQRDLTDSTVLRNVGTSLGYALLTLNSTLRGLDKLRVNPDRLRADLDANWAVLAEAIQTILRREGYPEPYEALKSLTRGRGGIDQASLRAFIGQLDVSDSVKEELRALRPDTYLGDAAAQAREREGEGL